MAQEEGMNIRVPAVITIKDVVTFVSIAVTITLAWGVFGTRITLIEQELVYTREKITKLEKDIKELNDYDKKLEMRLRDVEDNVQTLWIRRGGPDVQHK